MAEGLNQVILCGNLGADPELRVIGNGNHVLRLRIATTAGWFDRNTNTRKEATEWHSVSLWGKRGESLAKFLSKGARILVVGSLRTTSYEDQSGVKRYRTEVIAQNVILNGSPRPHGNDDLDPEPRAGDEYPGDAPGGDDDIPF